MVSAVHSNCVFCYFHTSFIWNYSQFPKCTTLVCVSMKFLLCITIILSAKLWLILQNSVKISLILFDFFW
jgi:hypothetical protein